MSSSPPPFTIPGYRLLRRLGAGGMATVWLARQESLSRLVAIKVLAGDGAASDELVRRFENEARTIARLDHPNIVQIHDVGRTSTGQIYYTMPHLPKGDLAARNLRDDPERVLAVVRALAEALGCAHEHGIVHRDVKPENVLFDARDRPMLADFGIALSGSQPSRVTGEGMTIGSSGYMSPEQARGQPIDGRSDLYSLGVVAYELLTGEMPFQGGDALAIALAHIEKPIPRLPVTRRVWQPLIDRALAKDPDERFQSAEEMIAATDVIARRLRRLPRHGVARGWRGLAERFIAIPRRQRAVLLAGVLLVALALLLLASPRTGDRLTAAPAPPAATAPVPAGASVGADTATSVPGDALAGTRAQRLRDAADALVAGRLAGPGGAADHYLAVLAVEPGQADARTGIASVLEALAGQAASAIAEDRTAAASEALATAAGIAARAGADAEPARVALVQAVRDACERRLAQRRDARAVLEPLLPVIEGLDAPLAQALRGRLDAAATSTPALATPTKAPPPAVEAPRDTGGPPLALLKPADGSAPRLAMAVHEVTRGEYAVFARETARAAATCRATPGVLARLRQREIDWRNPGFAQDDHHPVVCVSWDDAMAYAAWLSRRTGARYRLPNSDEWLLAARRDGRATGCAVANLDSHANGCNDGYAYTAPVGRFAPGASGIAGLAGNVAEWVDVCARPGRRGNDCPVHRFRGLSWLDDDAESNIDRMDKAAAGVGFANVGIRVVRELP